MDKKWFLENTEEIIDSIESIASKIEADLMTCKFISKSTREEILELIISEKYEIAANELLDSINKTKTSSDSLAYRRWIVDHEVFALLDLIEKLELYKELLDPEPVFFNGDIIIIDPALFLTDVDYISSDHGSKKSWI